MGESVRMTQVTAMVLRAVAAGHGYGFDVMDASGLPSGTVYPALRRLEKAGHLRASWEASDVARAEGRPRRRVYALTPHGRRALPEAEARLTEAMSRLEDLGAAPPETAGP